MASVIGNIQIFKGCSVHFFASSQFLRYSHFKILTFKKSVTVTEYNFSDDTIRWRMPKSTNICHKFWASYYHFKDIQISNFFLHSKSRSMSRNAIFTITPLDDKCKNLQMSPTNFCTSSYRLRDIKIKKVLPWRSR